MNKLPVNKNTAVHIDRLVKGNSSVVLISGATGSGKTEIAISMSERILKGTSENLMSLGRILVVEGSTAGIDDIRAIIKRISIKSSDSRAIIINDVDGLGHEAQNALLKTLEQLPSSTKFILTTTHPETVLATIRSRAASVIVRPISLDDAHKFFGGQSKDIEKYWSMSGGQAGELANLLSNDSPLDSAITDAKQFLSLSVYERLVFIDKYNSSRDELLLFTDALSRILKAATTGATTKNRATLTRLVVARKTLLDIKKFLNSNASTKLVALKLATSLEV